MSLIAHVSGVPVEELLLPLVPGGGVLWLALRAAATRFRQPQRRR
jgi:hypothetical protein